MLCERCGYEMKKDGRRPYQNGSIGQKMLCVKCQFRKTIVQPGVPEAPKEPESIEAVLAKDREVRKLKAEVADLKRKQAAMHQELDKAHAQNELVSDIRAASLKPGYGAPAIIHKPQGQGAAIAIASDWHCEEVVRPETINGMNEYNPEIAEERAENFFRNLLKLVQKERKDLDVDTLVLGILGDIITGFIHEELVESNAMSPIRASIFARDLLTRGIKYLLKHGDFKSIIVPCCYGNHGRTTVKIRVSTGAANNYEYLVYKILEDELKDDTLQWQVAEGYLNYVEVYGKVLRFQHGDATKYAGGIGGLTIPLTKYIYRLNEQRRADRDFIAHWHQLFWHSLFTVNGSLIGMGPYSQRIGASPERPQQSFEILDAKRGFTGKYPILVQREG